MQGGHAGMQHPQQHPLRQDRGGPLDAGALRWLCWLLGWPQLRQVLQVGPPQPPGCCWRELKDRKLREQHPSLREQHPSSPARPPRAPIAPCGALRDGDLRCSLRQIKSTDELPNPNL